MSEKRSDDAVSEVIAFMLIFAMIIVALAVWVMYSVPAEGHNAEIQHDEDVLRQFADIKIGVDLLWTTEKEDTTIQRLVSLSPTRGTDLSTLLFLYPSMGSGTIRIGNGTKISFYEKNESTISHGSYSKGNQSNLSLLRISYTSFNEHSDDFSIIYDGGAVFYGGVDKDQYLLASPISGDGSLYVINASVPNEEIILGNFPVAVNLTYTGKSETYEVYEYGNMTSDYLDYWNNTLQDIRNITILNYDIDVKVTA